MYKLLSFDVYGTLINTPPINVKAFRLILEQAGASKIDALAFYQFWESRNIIHYREPYRRYREIGELSLEEAFENFGAHGTEGPIGRASGPSAFRGEAEAP
jgi:2-haloacid dehalogenase